MSEESKKECGGGDNGCATDHSNNEAGDSAKGDDSTTRMLSEKGRTEVAVRLDAFGKKATESKFVQSPDSTEYKFTKGKIFSILFGMFLMFSSIYSFVYTPFEFLMTERLRMMPGFPPYDWWVDPPDEVLLKAYIFNVTNGDAFINGTDSKLAVQEIGPFVYREKLSHSDIVFNDNGTLTYTANRSTVFLPKLSVNVSLDARLVVPNMALLGAASYLSGSSAFVRGGFNFLIRRLKVSPLVETTPYNYMWNWTDPLLNLGQTLLPLFVPIDNIGILNKIYSDFIDRVTVYIGPGNDRRFFLIDRFHGSPRLGYWPDERCDTAVNSTEGVTYPQGMTRNDTIRYLRKTICRVAPLYWKKDLIKKSMTAYRFELPETVFHRAARKEDDCYTLPGSTPLPNGVADVSPCYYNFPIGISLPHFYGAVDEVLNMVDGLKPEKEKHGSYVILEPTTGIPMESRARSQCNIVMGNMRGMSNNLHRFSNVILPMFWLEYGQVDLPWYVTALMYFTVVILPKTQHWISLVFLITGTGLMYSGFSTYFSYIYRRFVFRYHKFEKIKLNYFR